MSTVRTWADGFGRWYAEVPDTDDAPKVAREAVAHELDIRGETGLGYRADVEPWDAVPSRGVLIFREK